MENLYKTLKQADKEKRYYIIDVVTEQKQKLRLYDMGFYEGNVVMPLYECWGGGTRGYAVKDTLIALRQKDAQTIFVKEMRKDDRE
mgnify:FL=1